MWRLVLAGILVWGCESALADDLNQAPPSAPPVYGQPAMGVAQPPTAYGTIPPQTPTPYGAAWPAPGQDVQRTYNAGQQSWVAPSVAEAAQPAVVTSVVPAEPTTESTWYFRQEAFRWNERVDGMDFVNEYGPLSTVGYSHRRGADDFRLELFGGTVAYDGGTMFDDGSYEPYHQSNGTDYLGCAANTTC